MRIALATCYDLPDWEVDDRPLHAAFEQRGVDLVHPAWDDPTFDWGGCDACLIRTTWDYMERRDEYVAWAQQVDTSTKLFNPSDIVLWNTHKSYLSDLESWGIPITPSVWIESGSEINLRQVLSDRGWKKAFLKPMIGATARETLRFEAIDSGIELACQHLERMLIRESMILQPYLSSVETEGELSLIMIDGEFSYAVRKLPVPGDYRVQDDFGALDQPAEISDTELGLAHDIMSVVKGEWLYGRTDFLRDQEGHLKLSELELVEPSLFFRHYPEAADRLADALCRRL